MKPLIVVFCVWSLPAHAAQAPARSPQFLAPAPSALVPGPPAPEGPAASEAAFENYFHAEAEFLASEDRYQEAPEGSAQRQNAAEARALAFNKAIQRLEEIGRRWEYIPPESWEGFALASERMRREAARGGLASDLFNRAEIEGWLCFRVGALRKLGRLRDFFEMSRAAELFDRQASEEERDSRRRAAYEDVARETWAGAYILLDERLEGLPSNDYKSAEDLADELDRRFKDAVTPFRLLDFYRRARWEAWSATRLGLIERILSATVHDLRAFREKYEGKLRRAPPRSEEQFHYARILADIHAALSDQPGARQRLSSWLRRAKERGIEHFHPRLDIERRS